MLVSNLSSPRFAAEPGERAALEQAAKHIERAFRAGGLQPMSDPYLVGGYVARNIEVEIPGASNELFVIGTHYDSMSGQPGAGVGVLTELATRLSRGGVTPSKTLRLVAFASEEGQFTRTDEMGSRIYARRCAGRGETIAGMISLELIGDGTRPLKVIGNLRSRRLAKQVARALGAAGPVKKSSLGFLPGRRSSAHWSFWKEGWPAVLVTDGAPAKKQPEPDFDRMERVAQALVEFVR